jgi:2-polyprenyl-3-methyl-5-hydroxy-6-metoxy-1,4-benzoquinol methylase
MPNRSKSQKDKLKDFLHSHPRLRNSARWMRWQAKKVPGLDRVSMAMDAAYFKDAGVERPEDQEYSGTDEYSVKYSNFLVPKTYGRVLDIGCGHGYLTEKIAANPKVDSVVGVDKIADFRCLHPNITYQTNNLTEPDDFPGQFDVIVSSEFIEHISEEDYKFLLTKITKALKPGGIYIGSTPRNPTRFKKFSGSRFHVREYNMKDLSIVLQMFFGEVTVTALSEYCIAWEAKKPIMSDKPLKLHLGCGEKYLEGYVNIDFPDTEQNVIKTKADVFSSMKDLSYPSGTVDEIRSHHLFEHFTRAEALKLLVRWRSWLKPNGLLVIETPDFATSAAFFLSTTSVKRKFQLSRHIYGSEEAGWAIHKDHWDRQKFLFILKKMGFKDIKVRNYHNGLSRHAEKIPGLGRAFANIPEGAYLPVLNVAGNMLPESFYKKYGSHKMPNVLASAKKNDSVVFDEAKTVREILSLSLAGKEGNAILDVWLRDYHNF